MASIDMEKFGETVHVDVIMLSRVTFVDVQGFTGIERRVVRTTALYTLSLVFRQSPFRSHTLFLSLPKEAFALETLLFTSMSMFAT